MSAAKARIEPGLLQLFRLFIGLRFAFFALSQCLWLVSSEGRIQRFPLPGLVETAILLVYLTWTRLQERMGKAFLPVALLIASAGPIIEYRITVAVRMVGGLQRGALAEDAWVQIVILLVPLLLISWQYAFRAVVLFSVGTTLLEALLAVPQARLGGPTMETTLTIVFIRSLLYLVVGYMVVRLMSAQREQHGALSEANEQLARYAATMEQLAISRERNRLARELHDTLAHSLSAIAVQLEAAHTLWEDDPDAAHGMLAQSLDVTRRGLRDSRRAIQALRADPLENLGLVLALRNLATSVAERADLTLELDTPERVEGFSPELEQGIFRIADEAIANVARHAQAEIMIVRLDHDGERVRLTIEDDGQGFDVTETPMHGHFGLRGLYERAALIGGKVDITSRPGGGTKVQLTVNGRDNTRSDM